MLLIVLMDLLNNIRFYIMIDRALNLGPVQAESYYFQLIPISLSIVNKQCQLPAQGTTYKFLVLKGQQKFDENKIPIQAIFQVVNGKPVLAINSCRLNFYVPTYNKLRKQDFTLQLIQRENNEDYEVGDYIIKTDDLVTQFKENNKNRHEIKTNFSEDYELEFQIYIEKSRMALQRNIRDFKTERINKSPLRGRKQEKPETVKKSLSGSQSQQNFTPSRDREVSVPEPSPSENNKEEKAQARTEVNEQRTLEEKVEEKADNQKQEKVEVVRTPSPPRFEARNSRLVQKAASVKKQSSQIRQRSEKNETQSRKTKDHIPIIVTKQRQLARPDTAAEVNLTESQRLLSVPPEQSTSKQSSESKEKLLLWLFLIVSGVIMYYAMHPNKKA